MIRAHIATYPPRLAMLEQTLPSIAQQVDQVFLCLNEYKEVPSFLKNYKNVTPLIPDSDLKDVGKFLFQPAADDLVMLADDDLLYGPGHVRRLRRIGEAVGLESNVLGFHGSTYLPNKEGGMPQRIVFHYQGPLAKSRRVHQLGTGTVLALGRNVPPLAYMQGSEKFVDVRFAKWLHSKGIGLWAIKRPKGFLRSFPVANEAHETIYKTFTRHNPGHVQAEIRSFLAV